MAQDVRILISADAAQAEREIQKLQATGKAVSDSLINSFETLGIRSTQAIEKERAAAVSAYERIKNSGVASADEIARAKVALASKAQTLDNELKNVKQSSDVLGGSFLSLKNAAAGLLAGLGVRELIQARVEMDGIKNSLSATSGALAAADFSFVRGEVDRLGLSLQTTAKDFVTLSASSKGTTLEGEQTRKIFSAVANAATVLGKSSEDTSGMINALSQMISKGNVQAEELRGQLGERLPGAYQLAAKAMGMTTQELDKHLEKGEVLASDLLPKLADELNKTYGDKTAAAASSLNAEIGRLNTEFFELKAKAADSDLLPQFFRGATTATKIFGDNLDAVSVGLATMTAAAMISRLATLAASLRAVGVAAAVANLGTLGTAGVIGGAAMLAYGGINMASKKLSGYDDAMQREAEADSRYNAMLEKKRAAEVAVTTAKKQQSSARIAIDKAEAEDSKRRTKDLLDDRLKQWKDNASKILAAEKERQSEQIRSEKEMLSQLNAVMDERIASLDKFRASYTSVLDSIAARDKTLADERTAELRANEDSYSRYYRQRAELATAVQKIDDDKSFSSDSVAKKIKLYDDQITAAKTYRDEVLAGKVDLISKEQAEQDFLITKQSLEEKIKAIGEEQIKTQTAAAEKAAEAVVIMDNTLKVQEAHLKTIDEMIKNIPDITEKELRIKVTGLDDLYKVQALAGGTGSSSSGANVTVTGLNKPFMGGLAIGTNYVPADGYAYLHQGEAVVPKAYNPAAGGSSSSSITIQGGINVTIQGGGTNQQSAAAIARQIYPELQKLARRQASA